MQVLQCVCLYNGTLCVMHFIPLHLDVKDIGGILKSTHYDSREAFSAASRHFLYFMTPKLVFTLSLSSFVILSLTL